MNSCRHSWHRDVCTTCGVIREVRQVRDLHFTDYFDQRGNPIQPVKCSGKLAAKNILLR